MMNSNLNAEDLEALRAIAREISEYRREFMELAVNRVVKEAEEIAASGYDPARGRGRGPFWAEGG